MVVIYTEHELDRTKILTDMNLSPKSKRVHYSKMNTKEPWFEIYISGFHTIVQAKVWLAQQILLRDVNLVESYERKQLPEQDRNEYMKKYYYARYLSALGGAKKTQKVINKLQLSHPEYFL